MMNNLEDGIYKSITKKELIKIFCVGSLIGAIVFLACYGWKILDVTNDSWLLTGQDISQHYIGWKFYRASAWHFPIGQIDGIIYPETSCIIFSDSIPLFAIFFKILSPILPETFQYFGIWGIASYILIGGISAVIVRKSTKSCWLCWIGSGIFCLSPYVFQRMYGHTALAGHWIILLAIGIWIYKPFFSTFRRKLGAWTGLLILGSLVHIYFIPMIMVFMFGFCLQDLFEKRGWKEDLVFAPVTVAADLIVLYAVGAFSKSGGYSDSGLGVYSANLNSLFNPNNYARYLKTLPIRPGQDEGFGYLGLGIILLLGCALGIYIVYKVRNRRDIKQYLAKETKRMQIAFGCSMAVVLFVFFILAWSPEIVFGTKTVMRIHYPEFILKILSTFRASGRFIWCVGYLIMTFCMMAVCYYGKRAVAMICMFGALLVQIADMQNMILIKKNNVCQEKSLQTIQSAEWEKLAKGKDHLVILPFSTVWQNQGISAAYEMGNFAVDHGMTINYFPLARTDLEQIALNDAEYMAGAVDGVSRDETMYILDTEEKGRNLGLDVYYVDGYYIGIAEN